MAQEAHGKAQTQEEAETDTVAAAKDWALDPVLPVTRPRSGLMQVGLKTIGSS
jgi:hypothetical protein